MYAQRPEVRVKGDDQSIEIVRIAGHLLSGNRVDVEYTIYATDIATGKVQTFQKFILCVIFASGLDMLSESPWFAELILKSFSPAMTGQSTWVFVSL